MSSRQWPTRAKGTCTLRFDLAHVWQPTLTCVSSPLARRADELRKANEYQKSARSKMCCLAMVAVIVAAAILVPLLLKQNN